MQASKLRVYLNDEDHLLHSHLARLDFSELETMAADLHDVLLKSHWTPLP